VIGGLGEVKITRGIEDDCRREKEGNGESRDLSGCGETRGEGEQEEKRDPERSVRGARRVGDALRTHEEIGPDATC